MDYKDRELITKQLSGNTDDAIRQELALIFVLDR